MEAVVSLSPPRSSFVTVLAWIFIALAGFATFISVLQNVMINTVLPTELMLGAPPEQMPAFFMFMFEHVRLFFLSFLVVSALTLVAAIGLLRRKNWARLVFVGILSLGIVWNIAGVLLQHTMFSSMGSFVPGAQQAFAAEFERMTSLMFAFSMLFAIGFSLLFGWLIRRLLSKAICAEFQQAL
jgi:hypothetical protein